MLTRACKQEGYSADWVIDSVAPDIALSTESYGTLLVDLGLPRMDGLRETECPLIFQRFHRAPESTGIEGSGLGLAIVQEIARNHGAQVSVGRSASGGALFTLQFQDQLVSQS